MGTSASSTGPNGQSPLVPPWAEHSNPITFGSGENQDLTNIPNQGINNAIVQEQISGATTIPASSNRLASARQSFGEYAKNGGNSSNLRSSLKKYTKGSGGGSGTSRRLASGITAGTALFRMMSGDSVTVNNKTLSLFELKGLTTDQVIDRITEHLTPENGDADAVRIALDYALVESLPDEDSFNTEVITDDVIQEMLSCYLSDLLLQDVVTGMGKAWFYAEHASKHHQMEDDLRELIKVITQEQVENLSRGNAGNITKNNISQLQIDVITKTVEIWENYND